METAPELWIGKTPQEVAREAARRIKNLLTHAITETGRASFILSGGTTPVRLFQLLALESQIPWDAVSIWWVDERWVPLDHTDSNFALAHRHLLSHVPISPHHIVSIDTSLPPGEAIPSYTRLLQEQFSHHGPDVVLLGMGADGHTASLFPGNPILRVASDAWCLFIPDAPKPPRQRVTWTPRLINTAANVIVLATGAEKASALSAAIESDALPQEIPIRAIHPDRGHLIWLADQTAAGALRLP